MRLWVEVLARNGEVVERHRVQDLPVRVGRGYDNDIVVDDPYVAPHHLTIGLESAGDGTPALLVARDAGSQNGVFVEGRRPGWSLASRRGRAQRQPRVTLAPDTVLRIGHTLLRVRQAEEPVPAELVDTTSHGWEGALPGLVAVAAIVMVTALATWIGDAEDKELLQYIMAVLGYVGGALVWATFWSILNRIFGGRVRFGRHLFIAACGVVAGACWRELAETLAFAFSWETLSRFDSLGDLAVVGGVVYHHILTVRPQARSFARGAASGLTVVAAAVALAQSQVSHHRLADELYLTSLKPPALRVSRDVPSAAFFASTGAARAAVDRARAESPSLLYED